ncbi:MAG TPA: ABC transporter permease [Bradyrhizobium sp.]|jgi:NitT/TauT family transport system permease protein|nr:ABC transporter permease [Bradyrhizobium sp.]
MTDVSIAQLAPRQDIYRTPTGAGGKVVIRRSLPIAEQLYNMSGLRKLFLLVVLAIIWEIYARYVDNELLFPTFSSTIEAMVTNIANGVLISRVWVSLRILLMGYGLGIGIATVLTCLAVGFRLGTDLLEILTAMFNPLPAIALLPLAMIWFGLGTGSLVFVLAHSVVWAVALNTHSGFLSVSRTLRMLGQNYNLGRIRYIRKILIPAAFPNILTGLKIAWAFAWRTLIAAELVFGVSSGNGGLGWFIYERKNSLDIPAVFAGLLTVIAIGLLVENLIFKVIEKRTVMRWGLQS